MTSTDIMILGLYSRIYELSFHSCVSVFKGVLTKMLNYFSLCGCNCFEITEDLLLMAEFVWCFGM